jgi:outer membrane protein TolC
MRIAVACATVTIVAAPVVTALGAQNAVPGPRLTLGDALRIADRSAYANRAANAGADAARAQAEGALRGILPGASAEAAVVRTTDPIGAFGFALKQRGVSQASFAPPSLNNPAGITNYGAGLVLEQPLVNADAWMGIRSARAAADAATTGARWTATTVRGDVAQAYYGAIVARELSRTMIAAERSAREHVRAAESAATNGFVTRSDALLARVRAGDVTVQRLEAESRARLARASLAVLLGVPGDTAFALPESLPSPADVVARVPQPTASLDRDDVAAAREATSAARFDLRRAQGTMLPRLNGFARYDWNSPSRIGGGSPAWTVGAAASWSVFGGGREIADARGAAARLKAAEAQAAGAEAHAALERHSADEAFAVALQRSAIADTAVAQSGEALRIVRKKYDGGLATVSELLDAGAADTQVRLMQADARYRVIIAAAARLRAWGANPAALATLDPGLR